MFVHGNANIIDFREKAFSLFFFLCIANFFCHAKSFMGGLVPWSLGVFRYRLLRLHLSTDCTSMLNLPYWWYYSIMCIRN